LNYYPFNVGDYAAHTAHLEPMEDLAYRRLLDQYYLREGPLPADVQATAKLVRMRSMLADVEAVLNEFFVLTEDGWRHNRCDAEVERMQDKQAKARASGLASANARKQRVEQPFNERITSVESKSTNVEQTLGNTPANVQLPTPTPTPTPKIEDIPSSSPTLPSCPHDDLIGLYRQHLPNLPQPRKELWTGPRARNLQSRWRWVLTATRDDGTRYAETTDQAIGWFNRFFEAVAESDFLTGRDGKWQGCDLAWLVKAENFAKVVQGNYANREGK